ncbi:undecaprenyl-diphosphatase [Kitasatospora gansuensis]|uniref:Undecaprenyl-diphosphatase n=1 Tax=Kitasatospora gansuensis TaxID=258050 RepID=A0A7W7WLA5_9ACTN|nr:phosphatase PAP2 family protein [Kitasatospora gansuensis]MBB4951256.1 undecaprenyl-diphosphatase [Kitasatospora gansuensis]
MTGTVLALDGSRLDGSLYLDVTDLAHRAPAAVDDAVAAWSAYGLVVFAALMLAAWWRARRGPAPTMAVALTAPLIVVTAFAADSVLKSVLREPRPCQVLPAGATLEACPAAGDWSLPSNHTVIAFAATAVLWRCDRRLGAVAAVAAAAMGLSRVFVGVHYPHDVVAGAVVGLALGLLLARAAHQAGPAVTALRSGRLRNLVGT